MLDNIKLRTKLFLLVALPLLALLFVSGNDISRIIKSEETPKIIAAITKIVASSGELIHTLQSERGMSAGLVASGGKTPSNALLDQRTISLAAGKKYKEIFAQYAADYPQSPVTKALSAAVTTLNQLEDIQGRIDSGLATSQDVISYYTGLIGMMRQGLIAAQSQCDDAALYAQMSVFNSLITAKEFAGQERATLNAALSSGVFSRDLYKTWIERTALQEEYIKMVMAQADAPTINLYTTNVVALLQRVKTLRENVLASLESTTLQGDPKVWFATSSAYIDSLYTVEKYLSQSLQASAKVLEIKARSSLYYSLALGGCTLFLTLLFIVLVVRNIVPPLRQSVTFARSVAEGKLDVELTLQRKDEIGVLATALNGMLGGIKAMIAKADKATASALEEANKARAAVLEAELARKQAESAKQEGMHMAAERIHAVSTVLSSVARNIATQIQQAAGGSQGQLNRLQETVAAMEEMKSTVLEVAKKSANAARIADSARQQAQHGSTLVMNAATKANTVLQNAEALKVSMSGLEHRVHDVDKVLNTISDIAAQTNLLALNAAIEAARAGEAGRGFAVVADEVRKLAEKTMNATKEVNQVLLAIQDDTATNIITVEQTVDSVHATTDLTQQSDKALMEIVRLVGMTTDEIRSIATASEEQSATSEEINSSIGEVNRLAVQTVSTMEQSTSGVKALLAQSTELEALVQEMQA